MRRRSGLAALMATLTLGCGGHRHPDSGTDRARVGDTLVMRSRGLGEWGDTLELAEEMRIGTTEAVPEYSFSRISAIATEPSGDVLVSDVGLPVLRMYSPAGRLIRQVGRSGAGPGEYRDPDGGLSVLPDGRILLRDPPNNRINVYAADGQVLAHWIVPGSGIRTSRPLYADSAGRSYSLVMMPTRGSDGRPEYGLARLDRNGRVLDTLAPPRNAHQDPMVVAEANGQRDATEVPFTSRFVWTFSPLGYYVHGVSDRYRIVLDVPSGPIAIERPDYRGVPVADAERESLVSTITAQMRDTDPGWTWHGPGIPDTKPPFKQIYVGREGRIWVQQFQPGRAVIDTVETQTGPAERVAWREPLLFDVFAPDGRYLGAVRGPDYRISSWASPVMDGDRMWAVAFDDLDVPYVVRLGIKHSGTGS